MESKIFIVWELCKMGMDSNEVCIERSRQEELSIGGDKIQVERTFRNGVSHGIAFKERQCLLVQAEHVQFILHLCMQHQAYPPTHIVIAAHP
jgi:hypothetical protein